MSEEELQFINLVKAKFDTKLGSTTALKEFPIEIQSLLKNLYSEASLTPRLMGTLLNGIFTEGREIFLMSQPLMLVLIKSDKFKNNILRESLNDKEYRTFVKCLRDRDIIEVVAESEKFSKKHPEGKAATWRLCSSYPLKLLNSLIPKELDEDGFPYLELSSEEFHSQWVNGNHAENYERWVNSQVEKELQNESNLQFSVEANARSSEAEDLIAEIENRKNRPFNFK